MLLKGVFLTIVSVVIPVYNESESIGRLYKALRAQDFKDMEIIFVVDNKTTDDSLEKIRELAETFEDGLIVIQGGDNLGEVRNIGLDAAQGKYVWFLDADDVPYSDFTSTMYGLAEEHGTDICQCNFVRSWNVDYPQPDWAPDISVMTGQEALYYRAKEKIPVTAWSMLLRREFLVDNELRFVEGIYAEDVDFIYRALERCNMYCYCDRPLYLYFQSPSSMCFMNQNKRGKGEIAIYSGLSEHFKAKGGKFSEVFSRRSALMRVRSAAHMDLFNFIKYIESKECKDIMRTELSDPISLEYIWLSIFPSSYYVTINLFLKLIYYRDGKIFGKRLKRI